MNSIKNMMPNEAIKCPNVALSDIFINIKLYTSKTTVEAFKIRTNICFDANLPN